MLALLAACAGPAVSDPWQAARDALLEDGKVCLNGDRRFCLDDPADLDPHVQRLVDRQYRGRMPSSAATATSLGRQARASYQGWWQRDPDAQARVLERVRAVWEAPTLQGGSVPVADLGLAPGPFVDQPRGPPAIVRSPEILGEHIPAPVLARALRALDEAFPERPTYEVRVAVPAPGGQPVRHVYRWTRRGGGLRVVRADQPGGAWVGAGFTLDALAQGSARVDVDHLTWSGPDDD